MDDLLERMLKMQKELDSFILKKNNVNPTLVDKCVALLVENVEFIEECGYKWWKKPKTNDLSFQSGIKLDNNKYRDKSQSGSMPDRIEKSQTEGLWSTNQRFVKPVGFHDERLKEELIDIFHFWLSICNSLDLDSEEIFKIYKKKWGINFERQNDIL